LHRHDGPVLQRAPAARRPRGDGLAPAAPTLAADVADAVARYEATGSAGALHRRLAELADAVPATAAGADALVAARARSSRCPRWRPAVRAHRRPPPDDARALVVLGNAYWLHGRGPDVVGDIAARALAADPANRGAWHLWALTESDPRQRMLRWQQVTVRFPDDDLARALFADAAASVAGAEHDDEALVLAIAGLRGAARPRRAPGAARRAREGARDAARVEAVSRPDHAAHAPPAGEARRRRPGRSPSSARSASA
jgi:hypothetical protein